jgi:hypothetical protein
VIDEAAPAQLWTKPFAYEVSDLRALNREVTRWWVLLPFALIFGWLVWLFGSLMLEEGFNWLLLGILLVIVVAASGQWTWRPLLVHRSLRRQGLLEPMTIGIGPEHLLVQAARADARIKWTGIKRIMRKGDRLFVFSSKTVAHIIPRRAFGSDADFQDFAAAAQEHWERARSQ